ncbi:MAG: c-type cytochrome [Steroidobacteraceae bacterium]
MRKMGFATTAVVALFISCAVLAAPKGDPPPPWAFLVLQKESDPPTTSKLITVPGSALRVSQKEIDDPFAVRDWFPQDHPPMPDIVAYGHRPLYACSYCHLPTGVGDPASAVLAGLPAAYIEQQLTEFRAGRRHCAVPNAACSNAMSWVAGLVSAADVKAAAIYFSKLRYHSRVHVVEAAMVPKTRNESFFPVRLASGGEEPLGMRILQMPDSAALQEDGDWRVPVTAYVPPGSIARGKALVASGGAGALPCASCHGARLQGVGMAPPLAGRPPTYIVRQLYDIQYGYRRGTAVALMEPEVAHLTAQERIAIAAYLGSLRPSTQ